MRFRLTGILLALAVLLSPLAAARASMETRADATRGGVGCCGAACTCDASCPCVRGDRDGAPSRESPAANPEGRDARTILVHVSDAPRAELAGACSGVPSGVRDGYLRCRSRPAGRALLAQISRWTT
jgi:hypothetical protein